MTTTARPKSFASRAPESADTIDRIPPHDLSAEAGVLGSIIIDPGVIGGVLQFLPKPDAFFKEENRTIFRVLVELFNSNAAIDGMILHSALKRKNLIDEVGGVDYIKELAGAVPTSAHAEYYAAMVKERWEIRQVLSACHATIKDCHYSGDTSAEIVDRFAATAFDISQRKSAATETSMADELHKAFEMLDRQSPEQLGGIPTGFRELDRNIDGLHEGEMIIVAARPSVGKTAWAMCVVEHVAVDHKIPVGVMSMEMNKLQITIRMLCSRAGVNPQQLSRNMMSHQDRDRLNTAVGQLSGAPIHLDDTRGLNIINLRATARRMTEKCGIKLLIIDYLQLMEAAGRRGENRQQEITAISRGIKALAGDLGIPIIALSQLNRASENECRKPRSSDLRESGSIEQDADVVLLLHREAFLHQGDDAWIDGNKDKLREALVIVAKQRNGPTGEIKLNFFGEITRFTDYVPGA